MISDGEFVTKTSKGEELAQQKALGRTGAQRTGKLSHRTSRITLQISSPSAHGFMIVPGFKLSLLNTYPCIENSKNL